jgi:hypothetical protein
VVSGVSAEDSFLCVDMDDVSAVEAGETITVFGSFDCDVLLTISCRFVLPIFLFLRGFFCGREGRELL